MASVRRAAEERFTQRRTFAIDASSTRRPRCTRTSSEAWPTIASASAAVSTGSRRRATARHCAGDASSSSTTSISMSTVAVRTVQQSSRPSPRRRELWRRGTTGRCVNIRRVRAASRHHAEATICERGRRLRDPGEWPCARRTLPNTVATWCTCRWSCRVGFETAWQLVCWRACGASSFAARRVPRSSHSSNRRAASSRSTAVACSSTWTRAAGGRACSGSPHCWRSVPIVQTTRCSSSCAGWHPAGRWHCWARSTSCQRSRHTALVCASRRCTRTCRNSSSWRRLHCICAGSRCTRCST